MIARPIACGGGLSDDQNLVRNNVRMLQINDPSKMLAERVMARVYMTKCFNLPKLSLLCLNADIQYCIRVDC